MAGWPDIGTESSDRTNGGRQRPLYSAFCASCGRRRKVAEMLVETNERSDCYDYLVCGEKADIGGCFEGPYPQLRKPDKADDVGPIPNLFYS